VVWATVAGMTEKSEDGKAGKGQHEENHNSLLKQNHSVRALPNVPQVSDV